MQLRARVKFHPITIVDRPRERWPVPVVGPLVKVRMRIQTQILPTGRT